MKNNVNPNRMIRLLTAGICLAGIAAFSFAGEAALPTRPQHSDSAIAGAAPVGNRGNTRPETAIAPAPANLVGYTEAEIQARMMRQYTPVRPVFRRVSGAAAGNDYKPGTMDVKIPNLFFPPDMMQEVSETFTENADGSFGTRTPGDIYLAGSGYSAAAQRQLQEEQWRQAQEEQKRAAQAGVQKGIPDPITGQGNTVNQTAVKPKPSQAGAVKGRQRLKTITVQVPIPAPSPFRALSQGDFYWFNNTKNPLASRPIAPPFNISSA